MVRTVDLAPFVVPAWSAVEPATAAATLPEDDPAGVEDGGGGQFSLVRSEEMLDELPS